MISNILRTELSFPILQTNPVTPVTPVAAILHSPNTANEFIQGQKYQAIIKTHLANGNYQVTVAGQQLQIHLPENFMPGNKLELVFISQDPALKFLLLTDPQVQSGKNTTSISTAGQFLGFLLQNTVDSAANKAGSTSAVNSHTISSPAPILPEPPINSTDLPGLLQKAIVQSGLFYESHQAQWINGENSLENLQQEPQGKLMVLTADSLPAKLATSVSVESEIPVNTQVIPLLQQQLNTLETGHLLWRGEVWQGQFMEWEIDEHAQNQEKDKEDEYPAQWRTQLRLSMPELGEITATIGLNSHGIKISLGTSRLETANLLRNNQTPFTLDLKSAGLNIQNIEVQCDETP